MVLFSKIGLQMKMLIINGQLILQTLIMIQILSILCMKLRGMALNIESNNINDTIPYGLEHYESDLKSAIATAKTSSFSSAFFDAITALGVTVDTSQF